MGLMKTYYTQLHSRGGRSAKIRREAERAEQHIRERFGTSQRSQPPEGVVIATEQGPSGWLCPAWIEDGRRCAFYKGVVHAWNPETELFEETKLEPPWLRDHQKLAAEGLA